MTENIYCQLIVAEAVTAGVLKELGSIFKDACEETAREEGNLGTKFMTEDGGNMTIYIVRWGSRQAGLKYHASAAYRRLVKATQHLLVGDFVTRAFYEQEADYAGIDIASTTVPSGTELGYELRYGYQ